MSSQVAYNQLQADFPSGKVIDFAGNNFGVVLLFPSKEGKDVPVIIGEEYMGVFEYTGKEGVPSLDEAVNVVEYKEESEHYNVIQEHCMSVEAGEYHEADDVLSKFFSDDIVAKIKFEHERYVKCYWKTLGY
jgi:hypothetical protein